MKTPLNKVLQNTKPETSSKVYYSSNDFSKLGSSYYGSSEKSF